MLTLINFNKVILNNKTSPWPAPPRLICELATQFVGPFPFAEMVTAAIVQL